MSRGWNAATLPDPARVTARRGRVSSVLTTETSGSGEGWAFGGWIVLAMIGTVAIKIHELIPAISMFRPALLITVLGSIILFYRTPKSQIAAAMRRPLTQLVLAYFAWCVASVPMSLWPAQSVDTLTSLLPLILLILALVAQPPTLKNVDRLQFWWVILFAVYGFLGRAVSLVGFGRLRFGFTYDPNDIAALMSMGFPLAIGVSIRSTGIRKIIAIVATIICIVTIVATRSRGGFLGLAAGALVLMFASRGDRRINMLFVLAIGAVLTWTFAGQDFKRRMTTMTSLEDDFNLTSELGRKAIWKRGIQYVADNPLVGVGVGNFGTAEGLYFAEDGRHAKWSNAHNAYVQAYAELGIPGGTIFIAIIAVGFSIAWRWSRGVVIGNTFSARPEYAASIVSFMVSGIFLSHAYFTTFFTLVAFVALIDHTVARGAAAGGGAAGPTGPRRVMIPGQRGGHAYTVIYDG